MKRLPLITTLLIAFALGSSHLFAANTVYTWDGGGSSNTGGNWSTLTNWDIETGYPTSGGDTGTLGDVTSGTRMIVYDSGASGTVSFLSMTQTTAGATNLLQISKNLSISNTFTLEASAGTAKITIDPGYALTASGGITLKTNGVIALNYSSSGTTGNLTVGSTDATALNISGGTLLIAPSSSSSSATNTLSGNLKMSSGAITIDNSTGIADRRLTITGNVTTSGGTISNTKSGSSGTVTLQGADNVLNLDSFDSDLSLTLDRNSSQSLSTNQELTYVLRGYGIKTIERTSGTTIKAINFIDTSNSSSQGSYLKLGSNLTLATGSAMPTLTNWSNSADSNGAVQVGIDTNGFTLDLSAGATSGVWTPTTGGQSGVTTANWTLSNSGTANQGSITASAFVFNSAGVDTTIGAGVTLKATGTADNNLSNISLGTGTIHATSKFWYAGSSSTLTSTRSIGKLEVGDGFSGLLKLKSGITAKGDVKVNNGSYLDLSDYTLTLTGNANLAGIGHYTSTGTNAKIVFDPTASTGGLSPGGALNTEERGIGSVGTLYINETGYSSNSHVTSVELANTSNSYIDIASASSYDVIDLGGATIMYDGTLHINFMSDFAVSVGSTYNIVLNTGGYSGTFDAIVDNKGYSYTYDYATGVLMLSAIPEPSTTLMILFALSLLALYFASRKKYHFSL